MRLRERLKTARTNNSRFGSWWWTVDRPLFFALILLMCAGAILVTAASPPVARRLDYDQFYFAVRQHAFLFLSFLVLVFFSLLDSKQIKRMAMLGMMGSLFLMVLLPFIGNETKGAIRWMNIAGMSIQPSEFLKPCFAVIVGWMFAERQRTQGFPGFKIGIAMFVVSIGLLIIQPDFGMSVVITGMFGIQLFLAGVPILWVIAMGALGVVGAFSAYFALSHVRDRVDQFFDPSSGDNYQVSKSLEAFSSGGFFGRGPGEGVVKWSIPDSHTDFIFSVAAEEFGVILALLLVALFAFIVLRGYYKAFKETDLFVMLASAGLISQFALQALVNMGVAVNLLPAKGMTLPFLSYGGSSLIAVAIGMGMMLGLTRRKFGGMPRHLMQGMAV